MVELSFILLMSSIMGVWIYWYDRYIKEDRVPPFFPKWYGILILIVLSYLFSIGVAVITVLLQDGLGIRTFFDFSYYFLRWFWEIPLGKLRLLVHFPLIPFSSFFTLQLIVRPEVRNQLKLKVEGKKYRFKLQAIVFGLLIPIA